MSIIYEDDTLEGLTEEQYELIKTLELKPEQKSTLDTILLLERQLDMIERLS